MSAYRNVLYLCGGPQSGGSTLVSWCFLQRRDMNGVLDAASDLLPFIDPGIGTPLVWYKSTTVCFRLSELADHYRDQGWEVRPLLVVRDLRKVWASLLTKPYACNGITAEDPPLRMRIRRFVDDWRQFRQMDWPILRYEDLLEEPRAALEETCVRLGLPWDEAMLTLAQITRRHRRLPLGQREFLENAGRRAGRHAGLVCRAPQGGPRRAERPGMAGARVPRFQRRQQLPRREPRGSGGRAAAGPEFRGHAPLQVGDGPQAGAVVAVEVRRGKPPAGPAPLAGEGGVDGRMPRLLSFSPPCALWPRGEVRAVILRARGFLWNDRGRE